jgi:hypothetical protein
MDAVGSFIDGLQAILQSIEDAWNKFSGVIADVTSLEGAISNIIAGLLAAAVVGGLSYLVYNLFQG